MSKEVEKVDHDKFINKARKIGFSEALGYAEIALKHDMPLSVLVQKLRERLVELKHDADKESL